MPAGTAIDDHRAQAGEPGHDELGPQTLQRNRRLWHWLIAGFVLFWLIVTSGAIFPLLVQGTDPDLTPEQRGQLRLLLLPCLAMVPVLFALRFRGMVSVFLRNPILIMLIFWIWLSILWSVDPEITARRALSFTANTILACYLVLHRDLDWLLKILSWCMLILLASSLVFILLLPELGALRDESGGVRGLNGAFNHKNAMGETIVFSLIIFFAAYKKKVIGNALCIGGYLVALALLVPTGAATSIVVALLILAIHAGFLTERLPFEQRVMLFAFATALACLVIGVVFANIDAVFAALGRDATLTGRTEIWPFVLQKSAERPILGYGFLSFWEMEANAIYVMGVFQWAVPSTHSGYLEVLLGLGWIALALLIAFLFTIGFRLAAGSKHLEPGVAALAVPSLAYYLTFNLVESAFFVSKGLSWIVIVSVFLLLTPGFATIRRAATDG